MKPKYVVDAATGCWNFTGAIDKDGYGHLTVNRKQWRAPRYFYEQAKGPIAAGGHIDHLCRNRQCVNPDHLEVVTLAENNRRSSLAKLNREQVAEIISLRGTMPRDEIAARFGVHPVHVSEIWAGKHWKD